MWAPVYVTLQAGAEGNPRDAYRLVVESTDAEEAPFRTTTPVPALEAGLGRVVLAYTVPGTDSSEFAMHLETADGRPVAALPKRPRATSQEESVAPHDVLFLGAGPGLSGFKRAGEKLDRPAGKPQDDDEERARRQFVFAEDVTFMPDRWVGYQAVDVVVLATGSETFVKRLLEDGESARRNALVEWVRRGGQLVVSVGRNQQLVARLLGRMPVLDCQITGATKLDSLPTLSSQWCGRALHQPPLQGAEVAVLTPGPGVHVLVREGDRPVLVQGSSGLGRVVLAAFDLDSAPFATWDGQVAFWEKLQAEVAPYLPRRGNKGAGVAMTGMPPGMAGFDEDPEIRSGLKRGMEMFEEVPVISFGWVALFILCYIALVGPLDYFVLKKVFKRLELTWVTFPLTVLVVSVAAYFTAYALKGDDLRINKIDLVDIDLHGRGQVYGHSWFTLFSPRIQSYTVGAEPATPEWAAPPAEGAPGPVLTVLETSERNLRAGSQGLFPRPYEYAEEERGLRRVPVPVWATRAFTASWRAPLTAGKPPIDTRDEVGPLRVSRARDEGGRGAAVLVGRITNDLPVELGRVVLFFREKWYDLGTLAPGESKRVEPLFAHDAKGQGRDLAEWFACTQTTGPEQDQDQLAPRSFRSPTGRPVNAEFLRGQTAYRLIKPLMLHQAAEGQTVNYGLRTFDQSWRLRPQPEFPSGECKRYRDEAILVARTALLSDRAEAVARHGSTATRLWLGHLPGDQPERPTQTGYMTQETYLRVFIPVRSP
jgi:hypothetical protein